MGDHELSPSDVNDDDAYPELEKYSPVISEAPIAHVADRNLRPSDLSRAAILRRKIQIAKMELELAELDQVLGETAKAEDTPGLDAEEAPEAVLPVDQHVIPNPTYVGAAAAKVPNYQAKTQYPRGGQLEIHRSSFPSF